MTHEPAIVTDSPHATRAGRDRSLGIYRQMRLMRRFEEVVLDFLSAEVREIQGPVHPYVGQEAVAAGVCAALTQQDKLISTHRGHGHCIGKGARTDRMMAELFGKRTGYCKGKGGSMHIADFDIGMLGANGIVAAGLPIATGAALAETLNGTTNVVVCMFGDGAAAAGPLHETLNIAALSSLPMIFVCENNGWSVNTQPDVSLAPESVAALAEPYGVPSRIVDGNDVNAVIAAAEWAVARARRGEGPSMIEALTFRRLGHATRGPLPPDSRDPAVLQGWVERDPIDHFAQFIIDNHLGDADGIEATNRSVEEELVDSVRFARESPFPDVSEAFEDFFV